MHTGLNIIVASFGGGHDGGSDRTLLACSCGYIARVASKRNNFETVGATI